MDRSLEARTLRQVNGRARLAVDLSEPLALIESLTSHLELTDADIGALSNSLVGLEGDVGALSNDLNTLSREPGPLAPQGPQGP